MAQWHHSFRKKIKKYSPPPSCLSPLSALSSFTRPLLFFTLYRSSVWQLLAAAEFDANRLMNRLNHYQKLRHLYFEFYHPLLHVKSNQKSVLNLNHILQELWSDWSSCMKMMMMTRLSGNMLLAGRRPSSWQCHWSHKVFWELLLE